jgi:stage V sporulation protein G
MRITDVRIQLLKNPKSKLRAFASITLDESLVIQDFQIIEPNKDYFFVGMPQKKMANGEYKDLIFPISTDLSNDIKNTILRAFQDERQRPENLFS